MEVKEQELTEEEADAVLNDGGSAGMDEAIAAAQPDAPDWAQLPAGVKPPPGKKIGFMRFRAEWTEAPWKGDRVLVTWNLSVAEEKLAYERARGNSLRSIDELAKATIRYIDGHKADWVSPTADGSISKVWEELGQKCRQLVTNYYLKTNSLSREEQMDFFANCFVVTTAAAG